MITDHNVKLDGQVEQMIDDGIVTPKTHPGICSVKPVKLPKNLLKSIDKLIESKLACHIVFLPENVWILNVCFF